MPKAEPIINSCRLCFDVDGGLFVLHFFWEWEIGAVVDQLVSCNVKLKSCDATHRKSPLHCMRIMVVKYFVVSTISPHEKDTQKVVKN